MNLALGSTHTLTVKYPPNIQVVVSPFDVGYMKLWPFIYWSTTVDAVLSCRKSHLGFRFAKETNVTNVFPYRQAITSTTLASDPCRYSAHGLWNNGSIFIYFFHLQGTIHRQGYSPVISPHRQWLPDTRAPCKRCCHPSIYVQYRHTHKSMRTDAAHGWTRTHKSNLSLNQIPSFCFSDSKAGWGSSIGSSVHW